MLPPLCSPSWRAPLTLQQRLHDALASRLDEERRAKTKAELVAELMARYRDPLLQAAFDLQSRIYNIFDYGFLQTHYSSGTDATKEYARENTLYVLADYLGWVEILRREVRFLDLGDEVANRAWAERLVAVRITLLSDRFSPRFRIFNGQQRAIGEIMIKARRATRSGSRPVGYAGSSPASESRSSIAGSWTCGRTSTRSPTSRTPVTRSGSWRCSTRWSS